MFMSRTVGRAERLRNRLCTSVPGLVKSDFASFFALLRSDPYAMELLRGLKSREHQRLAPFVAAFGDARPGDDHLHLEFADTLESRAAFGFLLIEQLLQGGWSTLETGDRFYDLGKKYPIPGAGESRGIEPIGQFVRIFVEPIIDYLEHTQSTDDQIRLVVRRYKQRSEWFESDNLQRIAEEKSDTPTNRNLVEKRLKQDFYRYLLDQNVDFAIAPQAPTRRGEVDVLSAKFPDGRRLVLEAKVYDGDNRDVQHVKTGIPQSARYADDWGEPVGYCLIYNVARDTLLEIPGAPQLDHLWLVSSLGREIRVVALNLGIVQPSSQSIALNTVAVDLKGID